VDARSDAFDHFLGPGIEGAEERASLLEDIRRISPYACASTRVGDCHAAGDAVWVRFRKNKRMISFLLTIGSLFPQWREAIWSITAGGGLGH
jgi:hypothetical protein